MSSEATLAPSVWHAGERAVQARAGVAERMAAHGPRVVRNFMPDQHRSFFAQLPFVLAGSVDAQGRVWASLLFGPAGFAHSPEPRVLRLDALPDAADPLAAALQPGAALGMLGIELPTRRRNRVNGHVATLDATGFTLGVDQSFGNCPQYIQKRDWLGPLQKGRLPQVQAEPLAGLDGEAAALIARADTSFVASAAAPVEGRFEAIDVSHRGGVPGFLERDASGAILLPDYSGNSFFNTLGNLHAYPRLGLLVIDFARGDLLQLTGIAEIQWESAATAHPGAQRIVRIRVEAGQWLRGGFPLRTEFREMSPQALAAAGQG